MLCAVRKLPWKPEDYPKVFPAIGFLSLMELVHRGLYIGFLPLFAPLHLGISLTDVGIATSLVGIGSILGRGPLSYLSERVGVGRVWVVSAAVGLTVALPIVHTRNTALLYLLAFAHGLALAPIWPGVMTFQNQHTRPGFEARGVSLTQIAVLPATGLGGLSLSLLAKFLPAVGLLAAAGGQILAVILSSGIGACTCSIP